MTYAITYYYRSGTTGLIDRTTGLFVGSDPDDAITNLDLAMAELGHSVVVIDTIEPIYNDLEG